MTILSDTLPEDLERHARALDAGVDPKTIAVALLTMATDLRASAPLATFDGRIVEVGEIKLGDEIGHRASLVIACRVQNDARAAGSVLYTDCTFEARLRR